MILLSRHYSTSIDVWAIGCIIAEIINRRPFLEGVSEVNQMQRIVEVFGDPNESNWPGFSKLENIIKFSRTEPKNLKDLFPSAGDDLINLMKCCFKLYPLDRITCHKALQHEYFKNVPFPTKCSMLPGVKKQNQKSKPDKKARKRQRDDDKNDGDENQHLAKMERMRVSRRLEFKGS